MTALPNTEAAQVQMEEQLKRAAWMPIEHLRIVATDKGRFANDRFRIFHHELELRQAIAGNLEIDEAFAREMMRRYAQHEISVIMSRELTEKHCAAIMTTPRGLTITSMYVEANQHMRMSKQHKHTIARLLNRAYGE